MSWDTLYPHRRTPWSAVLANGESGTFDPDTGQTDVIGPGEDARLPGLATTLVHGDLVAYRPLRRATIAAADGYYKVVRPSRVGDVVDRHRRFAGHARAVGFSVPDIRWVDARRGVVALTSVAGHPLRNGAKDPASLRVLGEALARLGGREDGGLPAQTREDVTWWIEQVRTRDPEPSPLFRQRLDEVWTSVPLSLPAGEPGVIHGDLHDGNVLVAGDCFALIDFDSAAMGHPVEDVVSLLAHLELRAVHAGAAPPIEASRGLTAGFDASDLAPAVARELVRLACLYRFRRRWSHRSVMVLDRALELAGAR